MSLQANDLGFLGFRSASLASVLLLDQAATPIDTLHSPKHLILESVVELHDSCRSYRPSEVLTANSARAVVMFAADSINAAHDVVSGWILSCKENRRTVL